MSAFGGKADIDWTSLRCLLLTQSGHEATAFLGATYGSILDLKCDILPFARVTLGTRKAYGTAGIHHTSWWRCCHMAGRGERTAGAKKPADHWLFGHQYAFSSGAMDRRFRPTTPRTRLDRGSNRGDPVSLGGGTHRTFHRARNRVGSP